MSLAPGASAKVRFTLTPDKLSLVDEKGMSRVLPGKILISIGGSLPGSRSEQLGASPAVQAAIEELSK